MGLALACALGHQGLACVVLEEDVQTRAVPAGAADVVDGTGALCAVAGRARMLYANDGMAGGRRILSEGWVDYSASPTPGLREGYGAGFFTNRGDAELDRGRVRRGMPADSFFASGTQGQRIVVAPAERLVVVRLGRSQDWPTFDIRGLIRLVADVTAALNGAR